METTSEYQVIAKWYVLELFSWAKKRIKIKKSPPKLTKTHANLLFDVEKDTSNNNNNMECSLINLQIQRFSYCKKPKFE